jgi:hypothetical protein
LLRIPFVIEKRACFALDLVRKAATLMTQTSTVDHGWIASEFVKGIDAERTLAADAKARADSPPDPSLGLIYHEIAAADERHVGVLQTIATRYGHTPSPVAGGGIGKVWDRVKGAVGKSGSDDLDHLVADLTAKAASVYWHAAWVHAFEALGESASARDLSTVLAEEATHLDALRQAFNRMVERLARGDSDGDG